MCFSQNGAGFRDMLKNVPDGDDIERFGGQVDFVELAQLHIEAVFAGVGRPSFRDLCPGDCVAGVAGYAQESTIAGPDIEQFTIGAEPANEFQTALPHRRPSRLFFLPGSKGSSRVVRACNFGLSRPRVAEEKLTGVALTYVRFISELDTRAAAARAGRYMLEIEEVWGHNMWSGNGPRWRDGGLFAPEITLEQCSLIQFSITRIAMLN